MHWEFECSSRCHRISSQSFSCIPELNTETSPKFIKLTLLALAMNILVSANSRWILSINATEYTKMWLDLWCDVSNHLCKEAPLQFDWFIYWTALNIIRIHVPWYNFHCDKIQSHCDDWSINGKPIWISLLTFSNFVVQS